MDDFPWRLEIQTKSQKGARGFPRLEEMQLSETRQTIQFVNLRWSRWINWCAKMRHDQIWDEVATCGQNSEFEDGLQLEGGVNPPFQFTSLQRHLQASDSVPIFRGPHGNSASSIWRNICVYQEVCNNRYRDIGWGEAGGHQSLTQKSDPNFILLQNATVSSVGVLVQFSTPFK
jgi:hypothetical protein